mmetsp:Transcript_26658/g.48868  ORF Transcript_26658/g.48868 Transcript_26658/m.48868 type:complete len:647 (-) Transcript_26658:95-2035(-)
MAALRGRVQALLCDGGLASRRAVSTAVVSGRARSRRIGFLKPMAFGIVGVGAGCQVMIWREIRREKQEVELEDRLEEEQHKHRHAELQRIREQATLRRLLTVVVTLFPLAVCLPLWLVAPQSYWRLVASHLESCGPCFVKLSQWLATRRDLFPETVCAELGRLHANVTAPWGEQTSREQLEDFLRSSGVTISELEPTPRATGSIAEVFFGVMEDGTEIAVKCLRPGIKDLLTADLAWMLRFGRYADNVQRLRLLGLQKATEEFCEHIQMQTDFEVEAAHLRRFRNNFASSGEAVRFPNPLFVSQDVLVLSREEGQELAQVFAAADRLATEGLSRQRSRLRQTLSAVSQMLKISDGADRPSAVAPEVTRTDVENIRVATGLEKADIQLLARESIALYMRMIFKDGFIHGDLHPGNIMLRLKDESGAPTKNAAEHSVVDHVSRLPRETEDEQAGSVNRIQSLLAGPKVELVILDAGLAIPLPRDKVEALRSLAISIVYNDFYRAADILYQQSPDASGCFDPTAFKTKLAAAFRDCRRNIWEEGFVQVSDACLRAFELVQEYNVGLDTTLTWALLGMLSVEGSARRLDPEVDCAGAATRYIITLPYLIREMGNQSWSTMGHMLYDRVIDWPGWEVQLRRFKNLMMSAAA